MSYENRNRIIEFCCITLVFYLPADAVLHYTVIRGQASPQRSFALNPHLPKNRPQNTL